MSRVSNRLKQVSALLTLLLAALLTGPLPGIDGGFGRPSSTALVELDLAQGATSLSGKPSFRDSVRRHAEDDSDFGDAAIPAAPDSAALPQADRSPAATGATIIAPAPARAFQARAPPTV